MDVHVIQTADPYRYYDLLAITSVPTRRFCQRQGLGYEAYIGIKHGRHPWHATFNRIPLLLEKARNGFRGWVIYLDADAYVADIEGDVRHFLAAYAGAAVLGASGGAQGWNVNSGILLLNLAEPTTMEVIERWAAGFEAAGGEARLLAGTAEWDTTVTDDQALLHNVLAKLDNPAQLVKLPFDLVGWPESRFIRQLLRQHGTLDQRMAMARAGIEAILGPDNLPPSERP